MTSRFRGRSEDHFRPAEPSQPPPLAFVPPTSGVGANGKPIFSWDQAAAQITREGATWSPTLGDGVTIGYAFRSTAPTLMPSGTTGFSRFSAAQIAATETALQLWSDVANITFLRVGSGTAGAEAFSNNATILFANYSGGMADAAAFAFLPSPDQKAVALAAGDVWVNAAVPDNFIFTEGEFGRHTLAHEIGHAIGLGHPGDYDGAGADYATDAVYLQDARMYTIMSYFGSDNAGGNLNAFSSGPQLHDIAAAQRLYGPNLTTRTGDTIYGFNSNTGLAHFTIGADGESPVFAIWDAGGIDTLDFSGYTTPSELDLREEAFSSAGPGNSGIGLAHGNLSIARGAVIENAIGGFGDDEIIGNSANNRLEGREGLDFLDGAAGGDTLIGGAGPDILLGGDDGDVIEGGAGGDAINGGLGFDLATWLNETAGLVIQLTNQPANAGAAAGDFIVEVEAFYLTNFNDAFTSSASAFVYAFVGDDTIIGSSESEIIDGGAGGDTINAGAGFDYVSYYTAPTGLRLDLKTPAANTSYAQGDVLSNVDAFILTPGSDVFIGADAGQNIAFGYEGDDILTGGFNANNWFFAGDGADRMIGGGVQDLFVGGAGADVVALATATPLAGSSLFGFESGADRLEMSRAAFGLSAGYAATQGSTFASGTAPVATTAQPTFFYYTNSGLFYFDPDGAGAAAATLLLQFAGGPSLSAGDLFFV